MSSHEHSAREAAFRAFAASAAGSIPGVDYVSITVHEADDTLHTAAATDPLAERADALQYELREGPCYAAVTDERFVLVNDLSVAVEFPRYAPKAIDLGVGAHAAIPLVDDKQRAGLNLYARTAGTFDRSTVQFAELFATHAGALLGYAEQVEQVEQLSEALHARTVIGTAVGILMERYGIDRRQAFAFLTRNSQTRDIKVRVLAERVIDGTFPSTPGEHGRSYDPLAELSVVTTPVHVEMDRSTVKPPIRLAIVDDYAVVVAGVASFLAEERIDVVETDASTPVITDVDIVLYDTFGQVQGEDLNLQDFVRDSGGKVVIYSWNLQPDLIEEAIAGGACGYLSKVLTGPVIIEALERIMTGEIVILAGDHETSAGAEGDWPGRASGLSPREAEIVALIARGLSNQEIAERAHVSINSIKSYIRSAYRKIGVERRSQALLWAVAHGFVPDIERTIDPTLRQRPQPPADVHVS